MSRTAESTDGFDAVSRVLDAFRAGEPVLVHNFDDREGETNLVCSAGAAGSADMARIRNNVGGLICVTLLNDVSESLGLPFIDGVLGHPAASSRDLAYDSRPSFSFTMNRRDSFTGITDHDRVMTISRLAPVAETTRAGEYDAGDFGGEFRAPGRVRLLYGTPDLLLDRQGHTGLGLALVDEAGILPAVVVCEILGDETGAALPEDAARDYADRHGFAFINSGGLTDELV